MNTWEKMPFKVCVIDPTYRGTRRGQGLPCTGLLGSMASGWEGWCDGSSTRNPVFGVGDLFLSSTSLLSCAVHALGREVPEVAPGCWTLLPPVLHHCPHLPQLGETNLVSGSIEGIKRQSPLLLQEHGFWLNVQEPLIHSVKQSLTAHHKGLHIDLNWVDKN